MVNRWVVLRSLHPFPSVLVAALTAAFIPLADPAAPISRYVTLCAAMLCYQFSIGLLNDVVDGPEDARTKPWKPVARGLLSRRTALGVAGVLAAAAATLTLQLSPLAWALGALGFACGVTYDVYLKRTPFSWVPYAIALPLVPIWVYASLGAWRSMLWWVLPFGAVLGLGLQLANQAPDVSAGERAGLPGRVGDRKSRVLAVAAFGVAVLGAVAVLVAVSPRRALLAGLLGGAAILGSPWSQRLFGRDGLFGLLAVSGGAVAVLFISAV